MSIGRKNKIIEYVISMEVGAIAPISDPTAIQLLKEVNNGKALGKCLLITNTHIKKLCASALEKKLKGLI